jgi:homoserine dehydrogenase
MDTNILVLKLGSSFLPDESALPVAVQEIHAAWRRGQRVVAVVSALATGEAAAVALLTIALERHGIPAIGLDADRIGLRTSGEALDSEPVAIDAGVIRRELARHAAVVIPGFGRGGSDYTALCVARQLGVPVTPVPRPGRPLRVGLIGCGTVGLGVFRLLEGRPDRFVCSGIAVRDPSRPRDVPRWLLTGDVAEVIARSDVVVELAGGVDPARTWLAAALGAGKHVVTANKAVLAAEGPRLERIAAGRGVRLLGSAAVGGAVPVLETIDRLRGEGILAFEGVLNGTSGYVLDRLAAGLPFDAAVAEAQAKGFAEADPTEDLDGTDAARKLTLVVRAAWGVTVDPPRLPVGPGVPPGSKLVASARLTSTGVEASVEPRLLRPDHPLAGLRGEENGIVVTTRRGVEVLRGKGAGRWPTAIAVLSDLLSIGIPEGRPAEESAAVGGAL